MKKLILTLSLVALATGALADTTDVQPVDVTKVGGSTVTTGAGTVTGAIRVELPSNGAGTISAVTTSITPGAAATNLGKSEDATSGTGAVGVLGIHVRNDGGATADTSANGDYAWSTVDAHGVQYVKLDHPNRFRCVVPVSTATTIQAVGGSCAAPGAGLSIYISTVSFGTSAAAGVNADSFPTLKSGTGGTCGSGTAVIWQAFAVANTQVDQNLVPPIKVTANNEVCWIMTTAGSKIVEISGWIAP